MHLRTSLISKKTLFVVLAIGAQWSFAAPAKTDDAPTGSSDSLSDYTAAINGDDSLKETGSSAATQGKPAKVAVPAVASGVALLPERPVADYMSFSGTPATEVALRFAREYRLSVVFIGDGAVLITARASKSQPALEMLKSLFPEPTWTVKAHADSFIVSQQGVLKFPPLSFSSLNQNSGAR